MSDARPIHDFHKSLSIGEAGEALFTSFFPHLIKQDKNSFDFLDLATGLKYEIKSDSYGLNGSPNFFMERYSNLSKKSPGGVWQAAHHGADYFIYMYPKDKTAFVMSVPILLAYLESQKYGSISVRNKAWITTGYKVPRADLAHLYREIKLEEGVKLHE